MAELKIAVPGNAEGRFFVDDTCIYCDLCKSVAPTIFEENGSRGWAYVKTQPRTEQELEQTYQALEGCPTQSIGDKENPGAEYRA